MSIRLRPLCIVVISSDEADDDLEYIAGKRYHLVGKLQERYGYAKEQAEHEIDNWAMNQRY